MILIFFKAYKYLAHVEACAATEETDTETASPTKEYYQNLQEAWDLLQAYLKMTDPSDVCILLDLFSCLDSAHFCQTHERRGV